MILYDTFSPSFYDQYDCHVNPNAGYQRRLQQIARQRALEEMERRLYLAHKEEAMRRYVKNLQDQEMERRRKMKQDEQTRLQQMRRRRMEEGDLTPSYKIIQGPDGKLYYLVLADDVSTGINNQRKRSSFAPKQRLFVGNVGSTRTYSRENDDDQTDQEIIDSMNRCSSESQCMEPDEEYEVMPHPTKINDVGVNFSRAGKSNNNSYVRQSISRSVSLSNRNQPSHEFLTASSSTLIGGVEDASDDESDDFSKSVWRNRRPSKGHWMEPVEDYDWMQ